MTITNTNTKQDLNKKRCDQRKQEQAEKNTKIKQVTEEKKMSTQANFYKYLFEFAYAKKPKSNNEENNSPNIKSSEKRDIIAKIDEVTNFVSEPKKVQVNNVEEPKKNDIGNKKKPQQKPQQQKKPAKKK